MKVEFHRGRAGWRWPLLIVLCLTSLGLQAQKTPDIDPALLIDEEEQVTQEELEMENIPVDERIFIEPWNEVPYNRAYFTYTDAEIREKWDYLMRGLRMPYPSADYLRRQFEKYPFLRDGLEDFDGDFQSLEGRYVNVWRHFFAGNFQTARVQRSNCQRQMAETDANHCMKTNPKTRFQAEMLTTRAPS